MHHCDHAMLCILNGHEESAVHGFLFTSLVTSAAAWPCLQEEVARREARATRFNISEPTLQYKPDEDEEAKARRAKKFGITYQPSENAMMDMGKGGQCCWEGNPMGVLVVMHELSGTVVCGFLCAII